MIGTYRLALSSSLFCSATALAIADPVKLSFSACAVAIVDDSSELNLPLSTSSDGRVTEWLKVPLNELTVGEPLQYRGPAAMRFYAKPDADAKPIASINLSTNSSSVLLVFLPNPAGDGYRIIPVADSTFPYGSYYFQNLSANPVAIDLGGNKHVLKPGESAIQSTRPGEDEEVRIHASIRGNARLIKSTSWRLDATQRELVFFYTRPGTEMVTTKHVMSIKPSGSP
jgi:hypothetical protein